MKKWFEIDLWKRVMLGLVLGLVVGLAIRSFAGVEAAIAASAYFKPFGDAFINLIRMLVVPLIFTTLVAGVLAMGDPKKLGSLGGRAIAIYMVTTFVAVTIGLIIGSILQPGVGFDTSSVSVADIETTRARLEANGDMASVGVFEQVMRTLLAIIPINPVDAMAKGDVLAVIFFAILFGIGILLSGEAGKPVGNVITSAAEAVLKLTLIVMETAPFGVFALMAWVMASQGLAILSNLLLMTLALYIACILHMLITHGTLIRLVARLPLMPFFRGIVDAQMVAFSTASSNATLPMTISCVTKNLGVSKPVASSVLPLGATINMDGTALYQGLIALFAAQALGIDLSMGDYVLVAVMATLVSIGTAGIPSVSLFLATTTLGVIGVAPDQMVLILAILFPFDRILDMMRTVTNITGDAAVSVVVAQAEQQIDEDVFRAPDRV
jgi:Na+/H+-dicarboxylate symporter